MTLTEWVITIALVFLPLFILLILCLARLFALARERSVLNLLNSNYGYYADSFRLSFTQTIDSLIPKALYLFVICLFLFTFFSLFRGYTR